MFVVVVVVFVRFFCFVFACSLLFRACRFFVVQCLLFVVCRVLFVDLFGD